VKSGRRSNRKSNQCLLDERSILSSRDRNAREHVSLRMPAQSDEFFDHMWQEIVYTRGHYEMSDRSLSNSAT
jgi:hypothetical protein